MLSEKEIKDTFELLGIKEDSYNKDGINSTGFIDKPPLHVKFQTTTSVQSK